MTAGRARTRADARTVSPAFAGGPRLFAVRVVNYLTNHVVNHVPSYGVRHAWYRRVLGVSLGEGSGIQLGCYLWFYGPHQMRVSIGAHSRVSRDCCLDGRGSIRIGDNVSISPEVMILTAEKGAHDPRFRGRTRPVVLEDHVWVGSRATILPGVTLGRGSVVGAGSVVTKDVPPLAIVAGSPARQVGARRPEEAAYVLDGPLPLLE